jgi:hypothetical protein
MVLSTNYFTTNDCWNMSQFCMLHEKIVGFKKKIEKKPTFSIKGRKYGISLARTVSMFPDSAFNLLIYHK